MSVPCFGLKPNWLLLWPKVVRCRTKCSAQTLGDDKGNRPVVPSITYVPILVGSLTTTRATIVAHVFFVITRQPLQLDRCSNPLRIRKVFLVLLKNIFLIGVRGSPGVGSQSWGVFGVLTNFDGPWTPIPWTKILAQTVFGNYTISLVDKALACPTSMS